MNSRLLGSSSIVSMPPLVDGALNDVTAWPVLTLISWRWLGPLPLILVKSPATYTVSAVGPGSSCCTSPSTVGLKVWLTRPVVASNANRFCRVYGVPFIGSATCVNRPPAIITLPTWTILLTSPVEHPRRLLGGDVSGHPVGGRGHRGSGRGCRSCCCFGTGRAESTDRDDQCEAREQCD